MDKLLTKRYLQEPTSEQEDIKLDSFLNRFTPWQRTIIREFYWFGPRYVESRYDVDIYNFLTNAGILEVE